ncbi:MAG: preprotein translocase subunit SecY [Bacteroidetes bacterium]|nr:preprotein translocase subunit SecY [Bacteroidota bacterium]
MKNLIQTIRNIFKIEDLRIRILNTLFFLLIYRLGTHIVLPGVDPLMLANLQNQTSGGVLGLLDMFSGGAFSHSSIFALGIMPYISASIVIQLLSIAIPYFQKLQKEGESGRKRINNITRWLTVIITAFQAPGYIVNLRSQVPSAIISVSHPELVSPFAFWLTSIIILVAGTIFVMWLGERITDKGLGNGISLIIMIGIVSRLPSAFRDEVLSRANSNGGMVVLLLELVALAAVVAFSILLVQGTRRIPVNFAKKIVGNKQYGGTRNYIPLKVNAAGCYADHLRSGDHVHPATIAQFFPDAGPSGFLATFSNPYSLWYNVVFATLIILFTYFYTAIAVNANQMADDMKRNNGFIPGVKPGRSTADFIDEVISRITLPGSIFLAVIAILPTFALSMSINNIFASFYGGTSLLILVGVVLDTLQQIESHLLMRHYDGLMKSGRIKGRSTQVASAV